jgi:hypothetical protein
LGGKKEKKGEGIFGGDTIAQQLERLRSGESFKGPLQPLVQQLGDPASATSKAIGYLSLLTGVGKITKGATGFLGGITKAAGTPGAKSGLLGTITRTGTVTKPGEILKKVLGRNKFVNPGYKKGFSITTQRSVQGKIPNPSKIGLLFKAGDKFRKEKITSALRYASNTKTRRLGASVLGKAGFSTPAIIGITTWLGTIPWAVHNRGDAIEALTFSMDRAIDNGDIEGYEDQLELFDEITDPGLWGKIEMILPLANVVIATMEKGRAARLSVESINRDLERIQSGERSLFNQESLSTAEEKNRMFEESKERQNVASLDLAEEKNRLFEESKTRQNEASLELAKEKNRLFAESQDEQRRKKLQERLEDTEFYKSITKGKTTSEKSTLTFGLLTTVEQVLKEITGEDVRG